MLDNTAQELLTARVFTRPVITLNKEFKSNGELLHPLFSSTRSKTALSTVHPDLVKICNFVVEFFDFSALEGARLTVDQQKYYAEGKSKLDGINKLSRHQLQDGQAYSMAIDIAPYPIDFSNKSKALARFYMLAGMMKMASERLYLDKEITHKIRWGGDWNSDNDFTNNTFDDLPHFELKAV